MTLELKNRYANYKKIKQNPIDLLVNAHKDSGPTAVLNIGPSRLISITNSNDIDHVLIKNISNYSKKTPGFSTMKEYLGEGLLTHEGGSQWKKNSQELRSLFMPAQINNFQNIINKWVQIYVDDDFVNLKNGSINLSYELRKLTLSILCDIMFGFDRREEIPKVTQDIDIAIQYAYQKMYDPFYYFSYRNIVSKNKFIKARNSLVKFAERILNYCQRRKMPNLVNILISKGVPHKRIIDEIITMIQAGHETSATALNAMFYRAFEDQSYMKLLTYDANKNLNDVDRVDTKKFDFINQFIWESLRFDPSTWAIDRYVVAKDSLSSSEVNKGDIIVLSPYIKHRSMPVFEPHLAHM